MIQFIIYLCIFMSSMIFLQMNHPLAMGLMLLVQTVLASLVTGLISKSFWFSYILFLVFLGGMLVLFIYVTSLASNEMFTLSTKTLIVSSMMMMITVLILMITDYSLINVFNENNEMMNLFSTNLNTENSTLLNKLYNYPTNLLTLILINYLLVTLIAVVKITNVFYGPLRQMN